MAAFLQGNQLFLRAYILWTGPFLLPHPPLPWKVTITRHLAAVGCGDKLQDDIPLTLSPALGTSSQSTVMHNFYLIFFGFLSAPFA